MEKNELDKKYAKDLVESKLQEERFEEEEKSLKALLDSVDEKTAIDFIERRFEEFFKSNSSENKLTKRRIGALFYLLNKKELEKFDEDVVGEMASKLETNMLNYVYSGE